MDLNLIKTFVTVVEAGSMTQAATRLKQPISRVSRAIARLERDMNRHLVLRTTRSFQITAAGRKLFQEMQPLIQRMGDVQRGLDDESAELTGLIRITAPEDFGLMTLAPIIAEISALHPGLEFDLNMTDDYVDLVRTETDIGIRAGRLRDSTLKAKRLGISTFVPVASQRYLDTFGTPRRPQDLLNHRCIHVQLGPKSERGRWVLTNGKASEKVAINARWSVTHKGMAAEMARLGLGITLVPQVLDNKGLVRILPGWSLEPAPVHLVYPPQRITSRKVREVSKLLEERLKPLFD
ncbi:MAG: LysR family transcriptional regulator [Bdellovibrionales bacterium]